MSKPAARTSNTTSATAEMLVHGIPGTGTSWSMNLVGKHLYDRRWPVKSSDLYLSIHDAISKVNLTQFIQI